MQISRYDVQIGDLDDEKEQLKEKVGNLKGAERVISETEH